MRLYDAIWSDKYSGSSESRRAYFVEKLNTVRERYGLEAKALILTQGNRKVQLRNGEITDHEEQCVGVFHSIIITVFV